MHIRLALAWCYKRCRRLDLAIETLEEALEAEPEMAIVHYNLACYWSLAGNPKLAVSFLSQAFELQPDYREHVIRRARLRPDPQSPVLPGADDGDCLSGVGFRPAQTFSCTLCRFSRLIRAAVHRAHIVAGTEVSQ